MYPHPTAVHALNRAFQQAGLDTAIGAVLFPRERSWLERLTTGTTAAGQLDAFAGVMTALLLHRLHPTQLNHGLLNRAWWLAKAITTPSGMTRLQSAVADLGPVRMLPGLLPDAYMTSQRLRQSPTSEGAGKINVPTEASDFVRLRPLAPDSRHSLAFALAGPAPHPDALIIESSGYSLDGHANTLYVPIGSVTLIDEHEAQIDGAAGYALGRPVLSATERLLRPLNPDLRLHEGPGRGLNGAVLFDAAREGVHSEIHPLEFLRAARAYAGLPVFRTTPGEARLSN